VSELPKGWSFCSLFDVTKPKQWKTIPTKELLEEGYPLYGANGIIGKYSSYTHEESTIMITCRGASCGNIHISQPKSYINGNAMALDNLSKHIYIKYLYYFLLSANFSKVISGTAQPQITQEGLHNLTLLIAPLNEQNRIADKLDSMLAKVDAAQARLDKIPNILKRFRQSVLAAATSGELTKEWREEQSPKTTIIKELDSTNDPYDVWKKSTEIYIPAGWQYCKLYQLGKVQGGGTPSKSNDEYWNGEIPWVTPKDMKIAFISNSKLTVTSKGVKESSAKLIEAGSIMFVVRGMILAHSFPVAMNETSVTVNQDMKCLTPAEFVDSKFLLFALQSLKNLFVSLTSSSTHGTKRLEAKIYNNVAVPIPSILEQQEIVRRVESLFSMADTVEKQYKDAKARTNRLTQSVLAKAYRG
jgi:type I restriction enzyme S subunit